MINIFEQAAELSKKNTAFVIATVIFVEGSAPGKIGFKILINNDGTTTGTIGGGAIEKYVIEEALKRIISSQSGSVKYILSDKTSHSKEGVVVPMSCNGRLTIFFEVYGKRADVYIFGGGHVGQALLYYLKPLNFYTILIDSRSLYALQQKNPDADQIICAAYEDYVSKFEPQAGSYIVILTHGHKYDEKILNILYNRKLTFPYIGMIASKSKAAGILKRLRENFGSSTDTSAVHSPVGLKIGGNTPAEIALAICAELQTIYFKNLDKK